MSSSPMKPVQQWSPEAIAMAAQAKVLSGSKLEQLVARIQRHTGRTSEACWRFVIQKGIKGKQDFRRWTEEEIDFVREELVSRSVDDVARRLGRSTRSVRNLLHRRQLSLREIRCDLFSLASLSRLLHIRQTEIIHWIELGWLQATRVGAGGRQSYRISPDALMQLYRHHLHDLLKRGLKNYALFEAYVQYLYSPKHTVGEQLLQVRHDKRERNAFQELARSNRERAYGVDEDEIETNSDSIPASIPISELAQEDVFSE